MDGRARDGLRAGMRCRAGTVARGYALSRGDGCVWVRVVARGDGSRVGLWMRPCWGQTRGGADGGCDAPASVFARQHL